MKELRSPLIKHPFGPWSPWSGIMVLTGTIGSGKSRMAAAYAIEALLQHHVTFLTSELPGDRLRHTIMEKVYEKGISVERRLVVHNVGGTLEKVLNSALSFARHADLLIIDQLGMKRESIERTMVSLREIERAYATSIIITVPGRDMMLAPDHDQPSLPYPAPANPSFSHYADIVMAVRRSKVFASSAGLNDNEVVDMMERAMNGDRYTDLLCTKNREHHLSVGGGAVVDLRNMIQIREIK